MHPTTQITATQFGHCIQYVQYLQTRSYLAGHNHANARNRTPQQRLIDDVNGHCGEIAVCNYFDIQWTPHPDTFHTRPDILDLFEIRTTQYPNGKLIIRDDDHTIGRCYILVTGNAWKPPRTMTLRGYIWGEHAEVDPDHCEYRPRNGGGKSLFLAQAALKPFTPEIRAKMIAYTREGVC